MELSRTASVLQFKLTNPEFFRTQVTKIKSRLFIRETAQPEKPL
jgi:hypothetical protein